MSQYHLLKDSSPEHILEICLDLKDNGIYCYGPLGFEDAHYWNMGASVFYKLRKLDNGIFNDMCNEFLGIPVKINYSESYALSIEEKAMPKYVVDLNTCYPSIDVSGLIKAANTIKKGFENMFGTLRNIEIVKVIFNEPATIVIWSDGTKTVVKAQNGEIFDREKGLAMAICKKAFGNRSVQEMGTGGVMKDDEIKFFLTVARYGKQLANRNTYWTTGIEIRVVINFLSEFIHHKRCWYLLQKWAKLGFYNYGVTLDLGWLELDKLPERYKVLLPEDFNIYGSKEIT